MEENDFSIVVGKPKSGKTTLTYSLITSIKKPKSKHALGFKSTLPKDTLIGCWNTEEKPKRVKRRLKQLSYMVNKDEDKRVKGFKQFYFKGIESDNIVDLMFETLKLYPEMRLGILDQLGDTLAGGYNDEHSAKKVIREIELLTNEFPNFSLLCLFHTNRTGGATNGVAGSYFDKKNDSQLMAELVGDVKNPESLYTNVYMQNTRNGFFYPFAFKEDKNRLPILIDPDEIYD